VALRAPRVAPDPGDAIVSPDQWPEIQVSNPRGNRFLGRLRRDPRAVEADVLLAASGRGDYGAFATLYDRTSPMVFGIVRRALGDDGDASAVTERIYVWLWRSAPRFQAAHECAYGLLLAGARHEISCRVDQRRD
jgi:RNA polymerase sigma-70 factor (ECF subfamily)